MDTTEAITVLEVGTDAASVAVFGRGAYPVTLPGRFDSPAYRAPSSTTFLVPVRTFAWPLFGKPRLFVFARLGDASESRWLVDALGAALRRRHRSHAVTVYGATPALATELATTFGLRASFVMSVGLVAHALERLEARHAPLPRAITIRPATSRDEGAVIALSRNVAAEPDNYVWPGAALPHQLVRTLEDHHVLTHEGKLYGLAGAVPTEHSSTAALEVMLDPRLRRLGLSRPLYLAVLRHLERKGITLARGASAHPATLHLAAEMGRRPFGIVFDSRATHPPEPVLAGLERLARVPVSAPSGP